MPIWLQITLGVSASLIAIFGAYISYKQWKLSAYKLKHDLFERRWAIYASAHDLIAITLNGTKNERVDAFKELKRKTISGQFLLPKKVCDYLNWLLDEVSKFTLLENKIANPTDDKASIELEHSQQYKKIENQANVLANKFKEYLELSI